jgi:phosphatidylserine/phosphatidylglycerophosphate/cardiolipin synthase-like enzyme
VIDSKHQIAYNKIILIDGRTVITGSFNFTTNAEKSNAENLLIIHDRPDLYQLYQSNMRIHFEHSQHFGGHHQTAKQTRFGTAGTAR